VKLDEAPGEDLPPDLEEGLDAAVASIIETHSGVESRGSTCSAGFVDAYNTWKATSGDVDPFAPAPREAWFSEVVQALPFSQVLRYPFKRKDHINVLEANVRLSLLKHLAREPANFTTRQLLGQDSQVSLGAFAKGRSSARRLNHVQRKAAAYGLAGDIALGGLWCDSFRMPADAPTREGGIVLPLPAREWVARFLDGDLAALDGRLIAP
jgi:hypothetical protein